MENKLWFKAKKYGFGWYPVSYEGWTLLLVYVLAIVSFALHINKYSTVDAVMLNFAVPFLVLTSFLLAICYAHGECAYWNWNKKE